MKLSVNTSDRHEVETFKVPEDFSGTLEYRFRSMIIATQEYENGLKNGWFKLFDRNMWLYEELNKKEA